MATPPEAVGILDRLAKELLRRRDDVRRFDEYYRGDRGQLVYASEEFAKYFSKRYRKFSDNWCGVVADAPVERLEVTGFRAFEEDKFAALDADVMRVWRQNNADFFSDQAFLEAILAKRAYALVWGGEDERTPQLTFEHPAQAIVGYDAETRRRKAGLKLWVDEDSNKEFATLYLPDELWKFQRDRIVDSKTDSGLEVVSHSPMGGWEQREVDGEEWPLPNPIGEVPLVELPNRPRLIGEPLSDIAGVACTQDTINLMWAYLLNAADYSSFEQRVVMGAEKPKMPVLDENGQKVGERDVDLEKFAVDRVVWLEDPNTQIGSWKATSLDIYTGVIGTSVAHIAAQSRTPPHYLMSKIANANAETLKTAETGLVKRTEEKTESFGYGLRSVAALIAIAQDPNSDQARERARGLSAGKVVWKDVEIRSESQAVDAAQKLHAMGYPLEYISRRIGMDPDEITEVLEMKRREIEMDPTAEIARQMVSAQVGGSDDDPEPGE